MEITKHAKRVCEIDQQMRTSTFSLKTEISTLIFHCTPSSVNAQKKTNKILLTKSFQPKLIVKRIQRLLQNR